MTVCPGTCCRGRDTRYELMKEDMDDEDARELPAKEPPCPIFLLETQWLEEVNAMKQCLQWAYDKEPAMSFARPTKKSAARTGRESFPPGLRLC